MSTVKTMLSAAARKFQVSVGLAIGVAIPLVADGDVSKSDLIAIAAAFASPFAVYAIKNIDNNPPKEG